MPRIRRSDPHLRPCIAAPSSSAVPPAIWFPHSLRRPPSSPMVHRHAAVSRTPEVMRAWRADPLPLGKEPLFENGCRRDPQPRPARRPSQAGPLCYGQCHLACHKRL